MTVKMLMPVAAAGAILLGSFAAAQDEAAPETPGAAEAPSVTEAMPEAPSVTESMAPAAAAAPAVECKPICVVAENTALSARRMYRCHGGPVQQVLCVDNPADCCCVNYSVPVCVPACCVGPPTCCGSHVGLLGRGYVTYRWPCGFEATIIFRVHGGVIVNYR